MNMIQSLIVVVVVGEGGNWMTIESNFVVVVGDMKMKKREV